MHTRRLNSADFSNRARQFDLYSVVIFDLLHKLTGRHGAALCQAPHAPISCGARDPLGGQKDTGGLEVVFRDLKPARRLVNPYVVVRAFQGLKRQLHIGGFKAI